MIIGGHVATKGSIKEGSAYEQARTKKMNAEAAISEIELDRIRGKVVMADDVVAAWENTLGAVKARLLSVPTKAAPMVAPESDAGACQGIISDMINEALEELANYDPEVNPGKSTAVADPSAEGNPDSKASPKTKRKSVGRPKKTTRLAN